LANWFESFLLKLFEQRWRQCRTQFHRAELWANGLDACFDGFFVEFIHYDEIFEVRAQGFV